MRRAIIALLVAALGWVYAPIPVAAAPSALNSIRPLQVLFQGNYRNICTAGYVETLWLTAAHCIVDDWGQRRADQFWIAGHQAYVVAVDIENDLALLRTPNLRVPALKLGKKPLEVGDKIETAGYSFGWAAPFYFKGVVANASFVIPGWRDQEYVVFDMEVAGGQSGSPILKGGKVVSVMQIAVSTDGGFAGVSGGAKFDAIKAFLAPHLR